MAEVQRIRRVRPRETSGKVVLLPLSTVSEPLTGSAESVAVEQEQAITQPPLGAGSAAYSTAGLWGYTGFLSAILGAWLMYLILPRGVRKAYCRAGRKLYSKRRGTTARTAAAAAEDENYEWIHFSHSSHMNESISIQDSILRAAEERRAQDAAKQERFLVGLSEAREERSPRGLRNRNTTSSLYSQSYMGESEFTSKTPGQSTMKNRTQPTPEHPAVERIPEERILKETMNRLKNRGVRLIAHGVQCDPKRVWIRLEQEGESILLTWQTEFPRQVQNQSGDTSIVLMRGALHKIPLPNVLYIDVGKKTSALMKTSMVVPSTTCFSLLTQNGSLDLQTNSRLERDALVCCLSMALDEVHTQDWRRLYEESPAPSEYISSINLTGISNISSGAFPSTFVDI